LSKLKFIALAIAVMSLAAVGAASAVVWPPDVVSGQWNVLGTTQMDTGSWHLVQRWNSDFYLTLLVHCDSRSTKVFVVDPDGSKIWRCRFSSQDSGGLLVHLNGRPSFQIDPARLEINAVDTNDTKARGWVPLTAGSWDLPDLCSATTSK